MCIPPKTDGGETSTRSILTLGTLMLVACLAGPLLVSVIGGLGAGVLIGAGGAFAAIALCVAVPGVLAMLSRRRARRAVR